MSAALSMVFNTIIFYTHHHTVSVTKYEYCSTQIGLVRRAPSAAEPRHAEMRTNGADRRWATLVRHVHVKRRRAATARRHSLVTAFPEWIRRCGRRWGAHRSSLEMAEHS